MAETPPPTPEEEISAPAPAPVRVPLDEMPWSQVWHLPVLLMGVGLFVCGMYFALTANPPNHDFSQALTSAAQYLQANNLEEAQIKLDQVKAYLEDPAATDVDRARFWQYYGDLNYLQNESNRYYTTDVTQANNRQILEYYDRSESFGPTLEPLSMRRYAQTLVSMGRENLALAMLDRLKDEPARRRYLIIKFIMERYRNQPGGGDAKVLTPLIMRFKEEIAREPDHDARMEEEIWVAGLQAQMMLDAGDPQRAITFLLKKLTRFKNETDDRQLAPLMVQFAKAYQMEGSFEDAQRWYRLAQQWLEVGDPLGADILIGLGQVEIAQSGVNSIAAALELFGQAARNYPSNPKTYPDALIGVADCQARLGAYPEAIDHFRLAANELRERSHVRDPRREVLMQTVQSHVSHARDRHDNDLALELLEVMLPLHQSELPPALLLELATVYEAIGDERAAAAMKLDPMKTGSQLPQDVRAMKLANQEASAHYAKAADNYRKHSKAVTLSDNQAQGSSLWKAAINYDRAQYWEQAIDAYSQFVTTRQNDPMRLQAVNHLGKALMADNQFQPAIDLFLVLVKDHPHAPETFDSLVPLARAYMQTGQNDAAIRDLESVVVNHPAITPQSKEYEEALIQLGKLFYRLAGDDAAYAVPAIERLTEAVTRYGQGNDGPVLRFLLADAYRKSVPSLDKELALRLSNSEQVALMAERNHRLELAQQYYNQSIQTLEARNVAAMTPIEKLYLRNAYFYQADCAFDRQRYDQAIKLYDTAARRWENDPASLVALVQIVNARCELGQFREAKVANDHALWQLKRIDDDKFDDPSLPMSREHWEDWLRWTSELDLFAGANAQ